MAGASGERPDRRFPKAARLLDKASFDRVFASGTRRAGKHFVAVVLPVEGGLARLGLAIAKRQVRRSSRRNLLKRLVRENFRCRREQLTGIDLVLFARSGADRAARRSLCQDLAQLFDSLTPQRQSRPLR